MKKQDFKVLKTKDLYPFPDNPFHVAEDETLSELAESIKEFGIVTPIITRPKEDGNGYEVIAGQRRVRASELAGINTVPAFVLPLDRDRAIITLVDSNLQRENILPSERAFAYKMKSEAMKRQGFRTDLTSSQVVTKLRTDDKVAQGFGVGRMTVQRFIRLTELIPPILRMVDEGKIALTPAVELSFLKKDEQENLFATMESEEATPSLSQAQRMKSLSQSGRLDMDTIFAIRYDNGYNPQETDIDSMMAAGQIGLMTNGGWLKGTLDASGINYGIASLPTVTGEDQKEYALGDMSSFMITTSATDETAKAAEEFINWWMTGTGLEACETTQDVDYSNVTPNAEWSISMCYLNAYLPTVNSKEYQAVDVLVDLTPSETAQVQMFTAPGTLFYSDAASCQGDYVQDWVFNGPTDPTYDDVQDFFADYQADLEDYIADYYD